MSALIQLSIANIRSFVRDRAALFWTFAFPLIFVVLFGLIFQGGSTSIKLGWVDLGCLGRLGGVARLVRRDQGGRPDRRGRRRRPPTR